MLDTGFDCPEVVNLVFARFTQVGDPLPADARARHAQVAQGKPVFTMFDFVGVTRLPRRRRGHAPSGGVIVATRPKKQPTSRGACCRSTSTTTSTRPRANGSPSTRTATWSSPRPRKQQAAELGARFEAWLLRAGDFNAGSGALAAHGRRARSGPMPTRWIEFTAGHFAFHPFTLHGRAAARPCGVFGGERRLDAMLAGLNAPCSAAPASSATPADRSADSRAH